MRVTRRRKRRPDPFASPEWVRSIFDKLKASSPLLSSCKEKDIVKLARAIRHAERYAATDTRRGRPSRWNREDLVKLASRLSDILARETQDRISLATFADHYTRILDFPADLIAPLVQGSINLFEAEQLARITQERLDLTPKEARRKRGEILSAHLRARASGEGLRRRVNELHRMQSAEGTSSTPLVSEVETSQDLADFYPYDTTHLFWEEIKQLGFAFRNIRPEDLTEEMIEELIKVSEPVWNVLQKFERQRQKK